ncbi:monovalent cation:proton antiporter-2 (CPA2) family protein [Pseudahrensia aquimaris]|uniref:Monovalent cation:proton antiporter-2 (CPA2) family protein n=1 Tax=Pseudahrensia aquimaris TaxID=744461 RepID=A0ABW3FEB3_9HYPH
MATSTTLFLDATVLLGGAVIAAPLFKKIGLGTVLGYLFLGILLGPVINFIHDGESVLHVAELGVVLLLFIVGLELKPAQLWNMRSEIFGLGALQVFVSGVVIAALSLPFGVGLSTAIVIGFGLALSSTAFALQLLEDAREQHTPHGKRAFSILLFQDIAIAPLLIMVAVLAAGSMELSMESAKLVAIAVASLIGLVLVGRYALNPLFGIIANTGAREAMIAAALFIVMGAALLMNYAGLSMAMGAFIAGVMLAESSYRHELEANIEPFRGILLGLFFIAVGLSVDLSTVLENWLIIALLVPALLTVKAAILYGLCRAFGSPHNIAVKVAAVLPQHGEFGFVLFSAAASAALLDREQASLLIAIVTLSMVLTPLCVKLGSMLVSESQHEHMEEDFEGAEGSRILMIGFSRLGQVTAQTLLAGGCEVTILDTSAERIRNAAKFGFRIYFGDGTRKDVLRAAGIEKATMVAVCTNKVEVTNRIVDLIRNEYPDINLYVRSYDRAHALELLTKDVTFQIRETFESALKMGRALLEGLGHSAEDAQLIINDVRRRDLERLRIQAREGSIMAGSENLHIKPVPEPLVQPRQEAQPLDEKTEQALQGDDDTADAKA